MVFSLPGCTNGSKSDRVTIVETFGDDGEKWRIFLMFAKTKKSSSLV
jgi:hypothetical protein